MVSLSSAIHSVVYKRLGGLGGDLLDKGLEVSAAHFPGYTSRIRGDFMRMRRRGGGGPGTSASDTHDELGRNGTGEVTDLLSLLPGNEGRHGLDVGELGDLLSVSAHPSLATSGTHLLSIDVDLDELDTLSLAGELVEVGADQFARATPRRPEVDDDRLVAVDLLSARAQSMTPETPLTRALNSSKDSICLTILELLLYKRVEQRGTDSSVGRMGAKRDRGKWEMDAIVDGRIIGAVIYLLELACRFVRRRGGVQSGPAESWWWKRVGLTRRYGRRWIGDVVWNF